MALLMTPGHHFSGLAEVLHGLSHGATRVHPPGGARLALPRFSSVALQWVAGWSPLGSPRPIAAQRRSPHHKSSDMGAPLWTAHLSPPQEHHDKPVSLQTTCDPRPTPVERWTCVHVSLSSMHKPMHHTLKFLLSRTGVVFGPATKGGSRLGPNAA
jgi:hypothetical protein